MRDERDVGDADDVGFPWRPEIEHALPPPADHDRRMRTLHRQRPTGVPANLDELSRTINLFAREVSLEQPNHLLQLGDSASRPVECQPHGGVLVSAPAGSDSQLEAPVGEQVEGCGLLRENGRYVVVDAEHPATDAQRLGDRGRRGHRRYRREVLSGGARGALRGSRPEVVVGKEERGIAEILNLECGVAPLAGARGVGRLHGESKRRSAHSWTLGWAVASNQ